MRNMTLVEARRYQAAELPISIHYMDGVIHYYLRVGHAYSTIYSKQVTI